MGACTLIPEPADVSVVKLKHHTSRLNFELPRIAHTTTTKDDDGVALRIADEGTADLLSRHQSVAHPTAFADGCVLQYYLLAALQHHHHHHDADARNNLRPACTTV